jgi:hypothetical protein
MNDFTINENDLSYKYLYKVSPSFKKAADKARYHGETWLLPANFCEYARLLGLFISFHVTLFILILLEIKASIFAWNTAGFFSDQQILRAMPWQPRLEASLGILGMWTASAIISVVSIFFIILGSWKLISKLSDMTGFTSALYRYNLNRSKKRDDKINAKAEKKPGIISMWLESHHSKICVKTTYNIERQRANQSVWPELRL